jgi:sulfoxide reductase catalytic subunit YedY
VLIKKPSHIKGNEITDKEIYLNRRRFLIETSTAAAAVAAGFLFPGRLGDSGEAHAGTKLDGVRKSPLSTDEKKTSFKDITNYNNFYEFGTDKYSPAQNAKSLITRPWTVAVEGEITHLSSALCGRLVHGDPLGGISA